MPNRVLTLAVILRHFTDPGPHLDREGEEDETTIRRDGGGLMALALAGCGGSDESVEVTGLGGRGGPDSDPGQNVGEVFADGPCEGWQDIEGAVIRYTFAYGEDSGVP